MTRLFPPPAGPSAPGPFAPGPFAPGPFAPDLAPPSPSSPSLPDLPDLTVLPESPLASSPPLPPPVAGSDFACCVGVAASGPRALPFPACVPSRAGLPDSPFFAPARPSADASGESGLKGFPAPAVLFPAPSADPFPSVSSPGMLPLPGPVSPLPGPVSPPLRSSERAALAFLDPAEPSASVFSPASAALAALATFGLFPPSG